MRTTKEDYGIGENLGGIGPCCGQFVVGYAVGACPESEVGGYFGEDDGDDLGLEEVGRGVGEHVSSDRVAMQVEERKDAILLLTFAIN